MSHRATRALARVRGGWLPALEVALAASAAWWVALLVRSDDTPLYAPIAAVVALGAGTARRARRAAEMVAGMVLAVGAAELAVTVLGSGIWQMGVVTGVSLLTATALFESSLARSYAAFNAAVLVALGSDSWLPARLLDATLGGAVAVAVLYLVPPNAAGHLRSRLEILRLDAHGLLSDSRRALAQRDRRAMAEAVLGSVDLERHLADLSDSCNFAGELVTWSPWRRTQKRRVHELAKQAERLAPVLRAVTTVVRVASRRFDDPGSHEATGASALSDAADALDAAWPIVLDDDGDDHRLEQATTRLRRLTDELRHGDAQAGHALWAELEHFAADLESLRPGRGGGY